MPKRVNQDQIAIYLKKRQYGYSMRDACRAAGFSLSYARTLESRRKAKDRDRFAHQAEHLNEEQLAGPLPYRLLCPEAQRAWNDFGYFQKRYFGRIPIPWQIEAAEYVINLLETPQREYVVVNAPPGSGKTLLFTHDLPAWITVRNRAIRGQLGSATGPLATRYTARLRRTFERTIPETAPADLLNQGLAFDAESTLARDFGRFRDIDLWQKDSFIILQHEGHGSITEKEPTWSAYGIDQGFIGGRYMIVVWDDLVSPSKKFTIEAKEHLQQDWDDLCEQRLEPGGVLVLQGQRLASDDLYNYCINKVVPELIDPNTEEILEASPMYHHLKFPAHYEDRCQDRVTHKRHAPAYPKGCLLAPTRISWNDISRMRANPTNRFQVVFQQEDADPLSVLVPKDWINGNGMDLPGCWDKDRDRLELPSGLSSPLISVATADPSPTRYWGIEWWVYHPATEQRFLMDLEKRVMEAPDFLDRNPNNGQFHGLMHEWTMVSRDLGIPITHWVIEINAAQRWLLQYEHTQAWIKQYGVQIIPHSTHKNKSDPEYGVESIAPHYQFGRVRLPGKASSKGRLISIKLIEEVTRYPEGRTDDLVMAQWFFEFNRPKIYRPEKPERHQWRPTWVLRPKLG